MTERIEQRYCFKFCQKLGDTQTKTIEMIQKAFGDDAMRKTQMKEWYNWFKDGHTSVDSEPRCGRPSTNRNDEMIAKVRGIVYEDCHVTIEEIVAEVGISHGSVQSVHSAQIVEAFLVKQNTPLVRQASYPPDLTPCDSKKYPKGEYLSQ
ncbi:protein GVQW3-like [Octopus bimaculoides]|uniref:protein GVQW3-like n=1 Tax=Octopus bimaculoides TaxID=37653 RepID=UPI00071DC4FF|nr:protein GVQW3-like [Octopus bimaculoides]|eukprot:XP_014774322.1 PREDICTED: putative uncharacterized protein FLJ37770 [Octopus bimaculoides]